MYATQLSGLGQDEFDVTSAEDAEMGTWFTSYDTPLSADQVNTLTQAVDTFSLPFTAQELQQWGSVALSLYQQQQLNEINADRLSRGLTPITTAQYTSQLAPTLNVGMTADTQKMLLYGGIGLVAVMLLMRKK